MNQREGEEPILTEDEIREAQGMTVEEVLDEGLWVIIEIGRQNGLSDETIDEIIQNVLTQRSRARFKVLD